MLKYPYCDLHCYLEFRDDVIAENLLLLLHPCSVCAV